MGERARIVTFRRGRTTYGVDVRQVRKVLRAPAPRALPAAPGFVAGGIQVEGRLEVLVDVAALFEDDAEGSGDRAVLVTVGDAHFALRADGAGDVTDLDAADLQPVPPFLGGAHRNALRGVLAVGTEQVLVVDLERLTASAALDALDPAGPTGAGDRGGAGR
jgi:purine-binding chemotaxis protein CheW